MYTETCTQSSVQLLSKPIGKASSFSPKSPSLLDWEGTGDPCYQPEELCAAGEVVMEG